nr:MAG TPA: hypothetical protein [Caudoviricetes sp.]
MSTIGCLILLTCSYWNLSLSCPSLPLSLLILSLALFSYFLFIFSKANVYGSD